METHCKTAYSFLNADLPKYVRLNRPLLYILIINKELYLYFWYSCHIIIFIRLLQPQPHVLHFFWYPPFIKILVPSLDAGPWRALRHASLVTMWIVGRRSSGTAEGEEIFGSKSDWDNENAPYNHWNHHHFTFRCFSHQKTAASCSPKDTKGIPFCQCFFVFEVFYCFLSFIKKIGSFSSLDFSLGVEPLQPPRGVFVSHRRFRIWRRLLWQVGRPVLSVLVSSLWSSTTKKAYRKIEKRWWETTQLKHDVECWIKYKHTSLKHLERHTEPYGRVSWTHLIRYNQIRRYASMW